MNQLDAARAIVAHIARLLQADLSVELWNGEVLPLGEGARHDIRLVIESPAAIGRLIRSPRRMTLIELYLGGGLDVVGGTLAQAFARYDHLRSLELGRSLDRRLLIRNALPFLTARGSRSDALGFAGRVRRVFGRGRDDAAMVQHHYDVSNDFYALFLDAEMQYSAGYFATPDVSLDDAQVAKMDLICRKLGLAPGKTLFDLGCGWGGLACHAAAHFGATVHGVTLSREQLGLARARVRARGLDHLVTLELRDYRTLDTPGAYDAISQIGMFEHVGLKNHDGHFAQMHRLLADRGRYVHQSITRRAPRDLASFRKRTFYMKFINRYIFPGGELDHFGLTAINLERHGFEVIDVEAMREHYHRSMKAWAERLNANRAAAVAEAGEARTRLYLLYLTMCSIGFERGVLGDFQILAQKRATGLSGIVPLREGGRR